MKIDSLTVENKDLERRKKGFVKAKSDFFRMARYGLSLQEHRVVYWAILAGQQDGKPFEPVTLSIKEFAELFGLSGGNYYSEIKKLSDKIMSKTVSINYKDEEGEHFFRATWMIMVHYHLKTGTVTIAPNPELRPFFEGKPFTTTEFYYLIHFTSQYAERLYELLKSMPINKKPILDFDINELVDKLAVPPSCRKNYSDLDKRVLKPAVSDINEYTDLLVEYKPKHGKYNKVNTVYFYVTKTKAPKLLERADEAEPAPPLSDEEQRIALRQLLGDNSTVPDKCDFGSSPGCESNVKKVPKLHPKR
jgi:plasmid replication initiation protein